MNKYQREMDRYEREYLGQKHVTLESKYAVENYYNMWDWALKAFGKFANFKGRARRKEFWYFYLAHSIILIGLLLMASAPEWTPLATLLMLILTIPMLATTSRRLHDVGRSGLWIATLFIPIIFWAIIYLNIGRSGLWSLIIASIGLAWYTLWYIIYFKAENVAVSVAKSIASSGVLTLMLVIPYLSLPVLLYFLCKKTSPKDNKWGAPAKPSQ